MDKMIKYKTFKCVFYFKGKNITKILKKYIYIFETDLPKVPVNGNGKMLIKKKKRSSKDVNCFHFKDGNVKFFDIMTNTKFEWLL